MISPRTDIPQAAVAIVGYACRFPGAPDVRHYWENLLAGVESVRTLSDSELSKAGVEPALTDTANFVRRSAGINGIDEFAADFFGYSPKEAITTDPQHRIFLETAWEALEDAGYDTVRYPGRIGVYAGCGLNTYLLSNLLPAGQALIRELGMLPLVIGNKADFMASQTSFRLGLTGPSLNVGTACSTSLVAVHIACQALLGHECEMALAGGVTIQTPQDTGYVYHADGVLSPDGHCRPFDAEGKGTVPGNGSGAVVLKRLEDAIEDGDDIRSVILATAINNDGSRKSGFSAPSIEGQSEVIATAMAMAEVEPETIGYIEAHGTGTMLGDPLEIRALKEAFRGRGGCVIGSVKGNIGHLDAAAGVASLIKASLCLQNRTLVPTINHKSANPLCALSEAGFNIGTKRQEWFAGQPDSARRAGVSSFGIGGTNAHAVLEEWQAEPSARGSRPWVLLPLSARSPVALDMMTTRLIDRLSMSEAPSLEDAAFTLQVGRRQFPYRRAILCRADAEPDTISANGYQILEGAIRPKARKAVFMFPGIGDQYVGMGRGLYETEPVFRVTLDRCAEILAELNIDLFSDRLLAKKQRVRHEPTDYSAGKIDLRAMLRRGESNADQDRSSNGLVDTEIAHPALFSIEYALAKLWMSWGVQPVALIGHSLGEYVAACIAGVMSLRDALSVVSRRAKLIAALPAGSMLAVMLSEDEVSAIMPTGLSLAAVNAAKLSVVAGPIDEVDVFRRELDARGVASRLVNSAHAFHSSMLEPIRSKLEDILRPIDLKTPQIPCISNASGTWITDEQATDPKQWAAHSCATVRFADGLSTIGMTDDRLFVEVGPGQSLASFLVQHAPTTDRAGLHHYQSLPGPQDRATDCETVTRALGSLWCAGGAIAWEAINKSSAARRRRVALPTYPFERERYWREAAFPVSSSAAPDNEIGSGPTDVAGSAFATARAHVDDPRPHHLAPEGEIEELMAALWCRILGLPQIGRNDNFFYLGGSSLLAVQLRAHIQEAIQLDMPLRVLFDHPSLKDFSACVEHMLLDELEAEENKVGEAEDASKSGSRAVIPITLPNGLKVSQFNSGETRHFYHDIFEQEVYARNGISFPERATIFDVGANIGLFSLYASSKAPSSRIFAFEPAPPLYDLLRKNLEQVPSSPTLFNAGISAQSGTMELTYYPFSTGMSSFYADKAEERAALEAIIRNQAAEESGLNDIIDSVDHLLEHRLRHESFTCETLTLSQVIEEYGVGELDLLKIDVQKSELDVLRGIKSEHWPLIFQIVIEVHDIDQRVQIIEQLLTAKGFRIVSEQDYLYSGSNIFNLYARRLP